MRRQRVATAEGPLCCFGAASWSVVGKIEVDVPGLMVVEDKKTAEQVGGRTLDYF